MGPCLIVPTKEQDKSASLYWQFLQGWSGPIGGAAYTVNDAASKILWFPFVAPSNPQFTGVFISSFSVSWTGHRSCTIEHEIRR